MNVAHVELPTISVTINTYVQLPVINVPLVYELPLSVAVTHVLLSEKVILTHVVYVVQLVTHANVGNVLSKVTLELSVVLNTCVHVLYARS